MPWYSSDRERRLWFWTAAVVVAIAATLVWARALAGILHDSAVPGVLFGFGTILVAATIATYGLCLRPGGIDLSVALGVSVAYLFVFVRMTTPADRTHLMEYGVLAVFVHAALTERERHGRRVPVPALLAILLTVLIGAIDEGLQAFIPSRVFDARDLLFNVLAAVMAVTAGVFLRRRWSEPAAK